MVLRVSKTPPPPMTHTGGGVGQGKYGPRENWPVEKWPIFPYATGPRADLVLFCCGGSELACRFTKIVNRTVFGYLVSECLERAMPVFWFIRCVSIVACQARIPLYQKCQQNCIWIPGSGVFQTHSAFFGPIACEYNVFHGLTTCSSTGVAKSTNRRRNPF